MRKADDRRKAGSAKMSGVPSAIRMRGVCEGGGRKGGLTTWSHYMVSQQKPHNELYARGQAVWSHRQAASNGSHRDHTGIRPIALRLPSGSNTKRRPRRWRSTPSPFEAAWRECDGRGEKLARIRNWCNYKRRPSQQRGSVRGKFRSSTLGQRHPSRDTRSDSGPPRTRMYSMCASTAA